MAKTHPHHSQSFGEVFFDRADRDAQFISDFFLRKKLFTTIHIDLPTFFGQLIRHGLCRRSKFPFMDVIVDLIVERCSGTDDLIKILMV